MGLAALLLLSGSGSEYRNTVSDNTFECVRKQKLKMYSRDVTFITLGLFLIFCDNTSSECTQPCFCALPDGHYYNLTGLAHDKPLSQKKGDWTVKFHPCTNIKIDTNANCSNTSLCTFYNKNSTNLGRVEETQIKLIENEFPIFEIHHENVTSRITIMCTRNATLFMVDSSNLWPNNTEYHFTLASPYGCKLDPPKKPTNKGLSTGSVLVILFFTFAGVYFIGGIMAMKFLRGATGWEMLPNHDFWCELPSLVRDGVIFAFNCCRADSYERI